uniref:Putative secreted protein n=1 Tax=Anopheles darlingi TaxID=43151 RepID=A0A2M4DNN1_ANODA
MRSLWLGVLFVLCEPRFSRWSLLVGWWRVRVQHPATIDGPFFDGGIEPPEPRTRGTVQQFTRKSLQLKSLRIFGGPRKWRSSVV